MSRAGEACRSVYIIFIFSFNNMSDEDTTVDLKDTITNWLLEEGFTIKEIDDPQAIFNYFAEDEQKRNVNVIQNWKKPTQIVIGTNAAFPEEILLKIQRMDEKERKDFFWKLRFGLLQMNVGFGGIELPFEKIRLISNLWLDNLSKDVFMRRMFDVRKALLYVFWTFERKFGPVKPGSKYPALI